MSEVMRPDPILGEDGIPFCPNCRRISPAHSDWCGEPESIKGQRTRDNRAADPERATWEADNWTS